MLRGGRGRRALVIGAESFSKLLDWQDRTTCVLFGDGAGAVVLQSSSDRHVLATQLHSDGAYANLLGVNNSAWHDFSPQYIQMQGKDVFRFATTKLGDLVGQLIEDAGFVISNIVDYTDAEDE